mgnify:CR=1 FL=1
MVVFSSFKRYHVKKHLSNITKDFSILKVKPEKKETPPVDLENKKTIKPFEAVTNIYGMPKYSELDPTIFLAPFFILFLALCLTDAGYGIIMIILTWYILKKVDMPDKRLIKLLFYGGWITLIVGALTGGWFGIDLENLKWTALADKLKVMQIINPVENPLVMMGVALALGIVQVWFGIFVKFYWKIKKVKDIKGAYFDEGPWLLLFPAIILFILTQVGIFSSLSQIAIIILYICLILVVISKGRTQKNPLLILPVGILGCLLYTSPSPRDLSTSRMPSSA